MAAPLAGLTVACANVVGRERLPALAAKAPG